MWAPAFLGGVGGAFFIFLMIQHMKTLPRKLEESRTLTDSVRCRPGITSSPAVQTRRGGHCDHGLYVVVE